MRTIDLKDRPAHLTHQLRWRAGQTHAAILHDADAMAAFGFVHIMGSDQNRGPSGGQVKQLLPKFPPILWINRSRRLIQK